MKFAGNPLNHRLGFFSDLQYIFLSRVRAMVKFKEAASNGCFAEELSEELPWKRSTFQKKCRGGFSGSFPKVYRTNNSQITSI